jgi:hypothetical protein
MGPGSRSLRSLVRDDGVDSIFKQPRGYASAAIRPSFASSFAALRTEGAGNAGRSTRFPDIRSDFPVGQNQLDPVKQTTLLPAPVLRLWHLIVEIG